MPEPDVADKVAEPPLASASRRIGAKPGPVPPSPLPEPVIRARTRP